MSEKSKSFEQAMDRLEEIVRSLEQGEVPLDQALTLFEEGAALVRSCGAMLDDAELQVVRLMKDEEGQPQEVPFDAE